MDPDHTYQPQYVWKQTTYDGLLPITNFTEEVKEDEVRKRGKDRDKGREMGQITEFISESQDQIGQEATSSLKQQTKEPQPSKVDIVKEQVLNEVEISVRVLTDEDKKLSIIIKKPANDKIKSIAEELAELLGLSKYSLTFFYKGEKLNFSEKLADKGIGSKSHKDSDNFLLCLKGESEKPKIWRRFLQTDDPCRQLSYISDEEAFDAITFVPKKDILFAGFSVYVVASTDVDFKVIYKYKVGSEGGKEQVSEFSQADFTENKKMVDIMLDQEIPVSTNKPITIMVRFQAGDEYFCSTLLGYGGENYNQVPDNEDKELFEIRETPDCTKGETDLRFGQIPRIFYFPL